MGLGQSKQGTIPAATLPLVFIGLYTLLLFYGATQIATKMKDQGGSQGRWWVLLLVPIVFIGILMIYQGIRNKRVSERISHSCKKDGTNCKGGEGTYTESYTQNHDDVSPWPKGAPEGLHLWEITWGAFRSVMLFTVLMVFITKKLSNVKGLGGDSSGKAIIDEAFGSGNIIDTICHQIFNPDNLPFLFLIFVLMTSFIIRSAYLQDQINIDKVDSDDIQKGGNRLIKAEADFSLAQIIGAPFFVGALCLTLYDTKSDFFSLKENLSGILKVTIFIGIYILWMIAIEKNRIPAKTWGKFGMAGLGGKSVSVYPNPDTYVIRTRDHTVEQYKIDDHESIKEALKAAAAAAPASPASPGD